LRYRIRRHVESFMIMSVVQAFNPEVIPCLKCHMNMCSPNKFIQAVMQLTCLRVVPSSNLGQETDFPDRGLSLFPSVPPLPLVKYWGGTSNLGSAATFHILSDSLFTIHFTIRRYIATNELLNHKKHIHTAHVLRLFALSPLVNLYHLVCALSFSI
jgi:hypothetical protein